MQYNTKFVYQFNSKKSTLNVKFVALCHRAYGQLVWGDQLRVESARVVSFKVSNNKDTHTQTQASAIETSTTTTTTAGGAAPKSMLAKLLLLLHKYE